MRTSPWLWCELANAHTCRALDSAVTDTRSVGIEKEGCERWSEVLISTVLQEAHANIAAFLLPLGVFFLHC